MSNISVRPYIESDLPAIFEKIKALALFEKSPESVTNTVERMKEEQDFFGCFVAYDGDTLIGIALYYYTYYTWVGKSMYLEDLYIDEAYRGQGIGSALLAEVFEVARQTNAQRVRWQVLDWNTPAIEVYKSKGAKIDTEWYNCDFDRKAIENYARPKKII